MTDYQLERALEAGCKPFKAIKGDKVRYTLSRSPEQVKRKFRGYTTKFISLDEFLQRDKYILNNGYLKHTENVENHVNSRKIPFNVKFSIPFILKNVIISNEGLKESTIEVKIQDNLVKVYTNSQRYLLFKRDGCRCVKCGIEGKYAMLTGNEYRSHFSFFTSDGILMTKDHIKPKSKGGKDIMENYQVMCSPCNSAKGNKY